MEQADRLYHPQRINVHNQNWTDIIENNKDKCNVMFDANDIICELPDDRPCYFAEKPRIYERVKGIMRCKMMHSQVDLPPLVFEEDRYNVAWHLRVKDRFNGLWSLHGGDKDYFLR